MRILKHLILMLFVVTQLLQSPFAPYVVSFTIPDFIKVHIVDKNGDWLKISIDWFGNHKEGWIYLYEKTT